MKILSIFAVIILLQGCAQLGAKVTMSDGAIVTERAYIAQKQFEAEKACYESRNISMPESPTSEQVLAYAVASMAMQNARPCAGTNANDVAIAKAKVRWSFASSLARVLGGAYAVGEVADFGKALAESRVQNTTTYNTEFGNVTQSNSSSLDGGSDLGSPSTAEGAIRSNSITIGGSSALAGDRAASGDTALVNGDSSVISSVEDSEVKGSDTAEDINKPNDQSTFDDSDGNPSIDI